MRLPPALALALLVCRRCLRQRSKAQAQAAVPPQLQWRPPQLLLSAQAQVQVQAQAQVQPQPQAQPQPQPQALAAALALALAVERCTGSCPPPAVPLGLPSPPRESSAVVAAPEVAAQPLPLPVVSLSQLVETAQKQDRTGLEQAAGVAPAQLSPRFAAAEATAAVEPPPQPPLPHRRRRPAAPAAAFVAGL